MKKIFITLTFIGINLCIFSQVPEFAPVGAKWWCDVLWDVEYSDSAYAFHGYALIECIDDSIIGGDIPYVSILLGSLKTVNLRENTKKNI